MARDSFVLIEGVYLKTNPNAYHNFFKLRYTKLAYNIRLKLK